MVASRAHKVVYLHASFPTLIRPMIMAARPHLAPERRGHGYGGPRRPFAEAMMRGSSRRWSQPSAARIEKQVSHDVTHQLARWERDVAAVCRWTRLCWAKGRPTGEVLMTAPHSRQPQVLPRPACTPTAIRAVLAANADSGTLQRYDQDLDAAYEQAREQGDVTPLVQTVKRWWFEADAWRDPQAQRDFLARIDSYRDEGPPPAEQRMSRRDPDPVRRLTRVPVGAGWPGSAGVRRSASGRSSIPRGIPGRGRDRGSGAVPAPPRRA